MGNIWCCLDSREASSADQRPFNMENSYQNETPSTESRPRRPPLGRGPVSSSRANNTNESPSVQDLRNNGVDGTQNKRQTRGPELPRNVSPVIIQPKSNSRSVSPHSSSQLTPPTTLLGYKEDSSQPDDAKPSTRVDQPNWPEQQTNNTKTTDVNINKILLRETVVVSSPDSRKRQHANSHVSSRPAKTPRQEEHQPTTLSNKAIESLGVDAPSSNTVQSTNNSIVADVNVNTKTENKQLTIEEEKAIKTLKDIRTEAEGFIAEIANFTELEDSNKHYYIEESLRRLVERLDDFFDAIEETLYLRDQRKEVYRFIFPLFDRLDEKVAENRTRIEQE